MQAFGSRCHSPAGLRAADTASADASIAAPVLEGISGNLDALYTVNGDPAQAPVLMSKTAKREAKR